MKYKKWKWAVAVALLAGFLYWQNNGLMTTSMVYKGNIPKAFQGFKIVQVSDLQNKRFGKNQKNLLYRVESLSPDIIVITGDLIDRNRTDLEAAMEFIRAAVHIAPIYYVTGNHEHQSGIWDELAECLTAEGVTVLDNGKSVLNRNGESITLLGLADKSVNPYYASVLSTLMQEQEEVFTILLSHHPELFDAYAEKQIDLAFCGHAHGGQIRLPFVGGLFAPNQGFFPQYTAGMYEEEGATMVVSRGLGNSTFPFRIWNRPELIAVTLQIEEDRNKTVFE